MALTKQVHSSHNSVTLKTIHASLFTDIAGKKIFYVMQSLLFRRKIFDETNNCKSLKVIEIVILNINITN